jgi:hypothetical protein
MRRLLLYVVLLLAACAPTVIAARAMPPVQPLATSIPTIP